MSRLADFAQRVADPGAHLQVTHEDGSREVIPQDVYMEREAAGVEMTVIAIMGPRTAADVRARLEAEKARRPRA